MKYINNRALVVLLSLFSLQSMAVEYQPELATAVFPKAQLQPLIERTYGEMSRRYTIFAEQFNYCQQKPKSEDCQKPYEEVKQRYTAAKALYDTVEMTLLPQFIFLESPKSSWQSLNIALVNLHYLDAALPVEQLTEAQLLPAVNQWLIAHELPTTDTLYLLQTLLIESDNLQQQ
ncbi:hypothetical protein FR932_10935 [Moritella marina ATCC 15381]|uniref:Uncharacterized protein n=1 Tax=Moritella marina ATCC 15381 TaxID=1202962 RepID=A0A5J6WN97_MORMI|nr:hypothetical protein [Moritella marina]QFI38325.1 hypothetical protein FR932_10935 [Moritella marina ATCC 15381]